MSNPARSTRNSRSHLSTDFDWETLPSVGDHTKLLFTSASPESLPMSSDRKERIKDKKCNSAAIPKKPTASDLPQAATPDVSAGLAFANTPTGKAFFPRDEFACLQLLKQTQDLEIRKLELKLQLANLDGHSSALSTDSVSAGKSLGDLEAPQKTMFPQPWPHIYAPGEPKLYNDLTLPEFSAGYLVIIQQADKPVQKAAPIRHFHGPMVFASTYQWSAVRSFHYKVLRSIELGLALWGDSVEHFKPAFFIPLLSLSRAPRRCPNLPARRLFCPTPRPLPSLGIKSVMLGAGTTTVLSPIAQSSTSAWFASAQITKP